ncbi:MAG: mechanosensitive ion channel family protein [Luminiphilus sp.]|nr:mechanosensitive ion channel family protein [Luminiphilus sp.]
MSLLVLVVSGPTWSQETGDLETQPTLTVADELDSLEALFYAIRQTEEEASDINGGPEDALRFYLDEESLHVLKQFSRIAGRILKLGNDAPERGELAARLALRNQQLDEGFARRFERLESRIAVKHEGLSALSGLDRALLRAQIDSMDEQRIRYLEYMIDVVDVRAALNFPAGTLEQLANRSLLYYADERLGSLQLLKAQRQALQSRLKSPSSDPSVQEALLRAEQLLALDVAWLGRIATQMQRVGLDTTRVKRAIIEEQTAISFEMVDLEVFNVVIDDIYSKISRWFTTEGPDMVLRILVFLGIVFLARFISRAARRFAQRTLDKRPGGMSQLLRDVSVSMIGGGVMAAGFLIALSQMGISLAPMLAGLGVAGFILGFALQETLSNFAAGGMILAYRPFDVGDFIAVAGVEGTVRRMNLVSTTITTTDNKSLIVPNSKIWGDVIRNYTSQSMRRVDTEFCISYSDSIEQAEQVLAEVLAQIPEILPEPETVVRVHRHGESSIDFVVRPWVKTVDYWPTYWTLHREVKLAFDRAGITIPFPQRDLHHFHHEPGDGTEAST